MSKPVDLYATASCQYCAAAREDLEWRGVEFVEYDVERDGQAYARMLQLTGGNPHSVRNCGGGQASPDRLDGTGKRHLKFVTTLYGCLDELVRTSSSPLLAKEGKIVVLMCR